MLFIVFSTILNITQNFQSPNQSSNTTQLSPNYNITQISLITHHSSLITHYSSLITHHSSNCSILNIQYLFPIHPLTRILFRRNRRIVSHRGPAPKIKSAACLTRSSLWNQIETIDQGGTDQRRVHAVMQPLSGKEEGAPVGILLYTQFTRVRTFFFGRIADHCQRVPCALYGNAFYLTKTYIYYQLTLST